MESLKKQKMPLPPNVMAEVLVFLPDRELLSCRVLSKKTKNIVSDAWVMQILQTDSQIEKTKEEKVKGISEEEEKKYEALKNDQEKVLEKARNIITQLDNRSVQEVKAYACPPPAIITALHLVWILLKYKEEAKNPQGAKTVIPQLAPIQKKTIESHNVAEEEKKVETPKKEITPKKVQAQISTTQKSLKSTTSQPSTVKQDKSAVSKPATSRPVAAQSTSSNKKPQPGKAVQSKHPAEVYDGWNSSKLMMADIRTFSSTLVNFNPEVVTEGVALRLQEFITAGLAEHANLNTKSICAHFLYNWVTEINNYFGLRRQINDSKLEKLKQRISDLEKLAKKQRGVYDKYLQKDKELA